MVGRLEATKFRLKTGNIVPTNVSYLMLESVSAYQALSERLMFTAR